MLLELRRLGVHQSIHHAGNIPEPQPTAGIVLPTRRPPGTLELPAKTPDPVAAVKLTTIRISAALKRARRRNIPDKASKIQAVLRAKHLGQPPAVTAAYAVSIRALIAMLVSLNEQVNFLHGQVEAYFGQHPDAEIIRSQPGLGPMLSARVLAEFGDDPHRYASAKARKNYAGTSPITRASGKKKVVTARHVRNDRLIDALIAQAFSRCGSPQAPGPTARSNAPAASNSTPPCANSPTGSSAFCTAASKPAHRTTRRPPGPAEPTHSPLDTPAHG